MKRSMFSKRYRFLALMLTIMMLVSMVTPTFAGGSSQTVTYTVGVQATCKLSYGGHWSNHNFKFGGINGGGGGGGTSTTYTVLFGAQATVETSSSHWKPGSSSVESVGLALPAATVPAGNVSVQSVRLSRGTNPIFSGSSTGPTFAQSTTTSFAGTAGAAAGISTFKITSNPNGHNYPPPVNKLTLEVTFKNNTTHQLITRTVDISGMPTTCNSSTPVFQKVTSEAPKKW